MAFGRRGAALLPLMWVGVATLCGATLWVSTAAGGGDDKKAPAAKAMPTEAQIAEAKAKQAARIAAFKKEFATCKTTLAAAIATAEASSKGKAHGADVELTKDLKLRITVDLLVGEKFVEVVVDPATGKPMAASDDDDDDDDGDDDDDDDDDGDGDDDD
jgi:hypothetical protein